MHSEIGFIRIDEPDARRTVGLVTRMGEILSPAATALMTIVRQQLREIADDFAITLIDAEPFPMITAARAKTKTRHTCNGARLFVARSMHSNMFRA